jgi:hypothetical protein
MLCEFLGNIANIKYSYKISDKITIHLNYDASIFYEISDKIILHLYADDVCIIYEMENGESPFVVFSYGIENFNISDLSRKFLSEKKYLHKWKYIDGEFVGCDYDDINEEVGIEFKGFNMFKFGENIIKNTDSLIPWVMDDVYLGYTHYILSKLTLIYILPVHCIKNIEYIYYFKIDNNNMLSCHFKSNIDNSKNIFKLYLGAHMVKKELESKNLFSITNKFFKHLYNEY